MKVCTKVQRSAHRPTTEESRISKQINTIPREECAASSPKKNFRMPRSLMPNAKVLNAKCCVKITFERIKFSQGSANKPNIIRIDNEGSESGRRVLGKKRMVRCSLGETRMNEQSSEFLKPRTAGLL